MKLLKEKNSLTLTAKKLGRDLEKVVATLVYYCRMQFAMFNAVLNISIIFNIYMCSLSAEFVVGGLFALSE